jgi:hypothetical protein
LREIALLWEKKVFESDYFLISSQTKEKNSLNSGSPQHSQQKIHAEKYKKRVVEEGGDEDDDDGGHVKKIDLDSDPITANMVLSQFEKVSRSKSKWKCSLKEGIMYLNGKEYFFGKGMGEFQW